MDTIFYNKIVNSTAHRPIRDLLSNEVLNNKILIPDLIAIAFNTEDKNHHKACWILELVFESKIEWLEPHLDLFCEALTDFKNESALRPIAKICLFACEHDLKHQGFFNEKHLQKITEACFDWLINSETKVATKAYSMRALFILGRKDEWINPELQRIIAEDSSKHTAGYKAAAKDILKRISK